MNDASSASAGPHRKGGVSGRRPSAINGMVAVCALFCVSSIGRVIWSDFIAPRDTPRIECRNPTWDFGEGSVGQVCSLEFEIANSGGKDLVVSSVSTQCGCISALASAVVIPPDHHITLPVRVSLEQVQERMSQSLTVHSNDPANPALILQVTGKVVASLDEQGSVAGGRLSPVPDP